MTVSTKRFCERDFSLWVEALVLSVMYFIWQKDPLVTVILYGIYSYFSMKWYFRNDTRKDGTIIRLRERLFLVKAFIVVCLILLFMELYVF